MFHEHGAHYAIGALALLMLIGLDFILLSLWSSVLYKNGVARRWFQTPAPPSARNL